MEVVTNEVLRKYGVKAPGESSATRQSYANLKPAGSFSSGCVRRARTREQGTALVMVGHAIEYLMDSRAGLQDEAAVTILMQANRATYEEGKEIVPLRMRLQRLIPRITARREARTKRRATR